MGTSGMSEVREALSVIEAEIVGALRQLKRLERERVSASSVDEEAAIVHLGEALHEIQQARAHCRLEEAIQETVRLPLQSVGAQGRRNVTALPTVPGPSIPGISGFARD